MRPSKFSPTETNARNPSAAIIAIHMLVVFLITRCYCRPTTPMGCSSIFWRGRYSGRYFSPNPKRPCRRWYSPIRGRARNPRSGWRDHLDEPYFAFLVVDFGWIGFVFACQEWYEVKFYALFFPQLSHLRNFVTCVWSVDWRRCTQQNPILLFQKSRKLRCSENSIFKRPNLRPHIFWRLVSKTQHRLAIGFIAFFKVCSTVEHDSY